MQSTLESIYQAVMTKQWWLVASLALSLVVMAVRWAVPKVHGQLGAWLNTDRGGAVSVLLISILGGLSTAMASGHKPSVDVLVKSLLVALTAATGYSTFLKKLLTSTVTPASPQVPPLDLGGATVITTVPRPPVPPQAGFIRPSVMMGLGLMGLAYALFMMAGCCTTPYCKAYTGCLKDKGVQATSADSIASDVNTVLTNGITQQGIITSLTGIAAQGAGDVLNCIIAAWVQTHQPAPGQAASPQRLMALEAAKAYLAQHPAKSCVERYRF